MASSSFVTRRRGHAAGSSPRSVGGSVTYAVIHGANGGEPRLPSIHAANCAANTAATSSAALAVSADATNRTETEAS